MRLSTNENKFLNYIIRLSVRQNGMSFQRKVHSVNSLHCLMYLKTEVSDYTTVAVQIEDGESNDNIQHPFDWCG